MTTVNDFTDILRIIREQPEWADALRAALLSKELLELPQRFAEFAETANKRFAALESDVAELKAGQARLESRVERLEAGQARLEAGQERLERKVEQLGGSVEQLGGSVEQLDRKVDRMDGTLGNLRGSVYETRLGKNIDSIVGQSLGIRGVRILKGSLVGNTVAYQDLMEAAEDRGDITEQERMEVNSTDFILQGRKRADQSTVYVAVEASLTAADNDINRAAARSETVRRATGETTVAVVACAYTDDARRQLAQERNVTLITIGEYT